MTARRIVIWSLAAAALVAAGVWLWRVGFPSEEQKIVRLLDECAETAGFRSGEPPAAAVLKLRRLDDRLDDRVTIRWRRRGSIHEQEFDRRELIGHIASTRKYLKELRVELSDLAVTVGGDTAVVEGSAQLAGTAQGRRWDDPVLEDLRIELVRRDGAWRVSAVTVRDFMER